METLRTDSREALARVVAMFAVADRQLSAEKLQILERLNAFGRIGTTREQFLEAAAGFSLSLGGPHGWMRLSDLQFVDRVLDAVRGKQQRQTVASLAAAIITASGGIDETERSVFDQMLLRWGLASNNLVPASREVHATA